MFSKRDKKNILLNMIDDFEIEAYNNHKVGDKEKASKLYDIAKMIQKVVDSINVELTENWA